MKKLFTLLVVLLTAAVMDTALVAARPTLSHYGQAISLGITYQIPVDLYKIDQYLYHPKSGDPYLRIEQVDGENVVCILNDKGENEYISPACYVDNFGTAAAAYLLTHVHFECNISANEKVEILCRVAGFTDNCVKSLSSNKNLKTIEMDITYWDKVYGDEFQNLSELVSIDINEDSKADGNYLLTEVEKPMFYNCPKLETVNVYAEGVKSVYQKTSSPFRNSKVEGLNFNVKTTKPLTIGKGAFKNSTLGIFYAYNSSNNPSDRQLIVGDSAFYGCNKMRFVSLWYINVTEIGNSAFENATLSSRVLLFDPTKVGPVEFGWTEAWEYVNFGDTRKIGERAFANTDTRVVKFHNYLSKDGDPIKIGSQAFADNTKLHTLSVDNTPIHWFIGWHGANGNSLFENCPLETVVAYNTAEQADFDAYWKKVKNGHSSLPYSRLIYPWYGKQLESFTWKGPKAHILPKMMFQDMDFSKLKAFNIPTTEDLVVCDSAFMYASFNRDLHHKVRYAGNYAFYYSELPSVEFATGTEDQPVFIGERAFLKSKIKSVKLLDGYYELHEGAFICDLESFDMSDVTHPWQGEYRIGGKYNTSSARLEGGEKAMKENIIPPMFISGSQALSSLRLSPLTTEIHEAAFAHNMLREVNLSDNITLVGEYAFANSNLDWKPRKIRVGKNVRQIGKNAFVLQTDKISNSYKVDLTWLSSQYNGGSIAEQFSYIKLNSIRFTDGENYCDVIPDELCDGLSALVSISIPDGTSGIGTRAFANTGLQEIIITPNSRLTSIGKEAFANVPFTGRFVLPAGVENIGGSALPPHMTEVDYYARNLPIKEPFAGFENLKEINLKEGVEVVPDRLFKGTSTTTITIPSTVKTLGVKLLEDVKTLNGNTMRIYYNAKNAEYAPEDYIEDEKLLNTPEEITEPWIYNPWGVEKVNQVIYNLPYYEQFYDDDILQTKYDIIIGEGVETIPDFLFAGFKTHRESLSLPNSVKKIGKWAFYRSDIKTVQDASSVTLDDYSFAHADSLRTAVFEEAQLINPYAFANCDKLESVTVRKAEGIGHHAFTGSKKLQNVASGNGLFALGLSAFEGCESLLGFSFGETIQSIADSAFKDCSSLSGVTLGGSITTVGDKAFAGIKGGILTFKKPVALGNESFKDAGISMIRAESLSEVPQIKESSFSGVPTDIMIWTNCAAMSLFKADEQWNKFTNYSASSPYSVTIYPAVDWHEGSINYTHPDCDNKTTLTAEPAEFFSFVKWSDGSTENPRTLTLTEDLQISATFEKTGGYTMKYFLFNFSTPDGATFSQDPSGWYPIEYEGAYLLPISNIELTANPHFRFDFNQTPMPRDTKGNVIPQAPSWICTSDEGPESCTKATMSFDYADNGDIKNAQTDTIVITFPVIGEMVRLTDVLQCNDNSMGGLYYYYDKEDYKYQLYGIAEGDKALYGDEIAIYAHPETGYEFTDWDDGSTDEIRTFTIDDKVHTANFEPKQFLVSFSVSTDAATINGKTEWEEAYRFGDHVILPATEDVKVPAAIGTFDHWEVNGKVPETIIINSKTSLKDPIEKDLTIVAVIKLNELKVQVLPSDEKMGAVETSGKAPYFYGDLLPLTAKPASDKYVFFGWSDGILSNPRELKLVSDTTITAEFMPSACHVNLTIIPENAATASGTGTYNYGEDYSITIYPAAGYELKEWRDGTHLEEETNTLSGLVYGDNINIEVELQLKKYTIAAAANDDKMGTVEGSGQYEHGSQVTLTAKANDGFRFLGWDNDALDNPLVFNAYDNEEIEAIFEAIPEYTITVVASPEDGGMVSGSGTHREGTEQQIVASANTGYNFLGWTDGEKAPIRKIVVYADKTYTALFEKQEESKPQYTITVEASPAEGGTISGGGKYEEGKTATLTATAAEGYEFVQWSDGSTENPRMVVVTENKTYTAEFKKQETPKPEYTVTLIANPAEGGTVSGAGTYNEGTVVTIEATAAEGYEFIGWSDGNTENKREITVNDNIALVANFQIKEAPKPEYTVTLIANPAEGGTVSGAGTYTEGTVVTIEATPAEGYEFIGWSDGNTENKREITVNDNLTLVANFQKKDEPLPIFTVTVLSADPTMGTVKGGGTFEQGSQIEIGALPAEGYEFSKWSDGNTDNPRSIVVETDIVLIANFAKIGDGVENIFINGGNGGNGGNGVRKLLRDGHIVIILPDGREFNATGAKMK